MMLSQWSHSRMLKLWIVVALLLLFGLLLPGSANATPSPVINTDDGIIDSGWGAPIFTSTCSNSGIPDTNEIKNAWVQSWQSNGTNNGEVYFRVQTCAAPAIQNGFLVSAVLDCDRNQTTNSVYDRRITYKPDQDFQYMRDGTNFGMGTQCPDPTPGAVPCPYGERVPASPNNDTLEWRVEYTLLPNDLGSPFPPGCRDAINIAFGTANATNGSVSDQTPLFGWDVPTAVDMKEIKASSRPEPGLITIAALILLAASFLGALVLYRRKRA